MPETSDRERSIEAYNAVVKGFHTFFGITVLALVLLHLFVLLPFIEMQTAVPALRAAEARTRAEIAANAEAQRALAASTEGIARFKRALDAAPAELSAQVGTLVARAAWAGGQGNYGAATVRVPPELSGGAGGPLAAEPIPLTDAIRRAIGRQVEILSAALDGALVPLRTLTAPAPDVAAAVRIAEESLGRNVLALGDVLREAFDADPTVWQRLGAAGSFAAAAPRGETWTKNTRDALLAFEERVASAAVMARSRDDVLRARSELVAQQQRQASERLATFMARLSWVPIGLELWTRLYPIGAGALALTLLVRLRRIMLLRLAINDRHLDALAPSWLIGPPGAPGRLWSLLLLSAPLLLAAHAAYAALFQAGVFTTPLGDRDVVAMTGYGIAYAAIVAAGAVQVAAAARGYVQPSRGNHDRPRA